IVTSLDGGVVPASNTGNKKTVTIISINSVVTNFLLIFIFSHHHAIYYDTIQHVILYLAYYIKHSCKNSRTGKMSKQKNSVFLQN
ncbi:hypothetical protein KA005_06320, partial [bacterium]|nr:hypothetical protein [bacterium]